MKFVRLHPYETALAGASLLVIIGALVVASHSATPTASGFSSWSDGIAFLGPTAPAQNTTANPTSIIPTNYGTQTLPYTSNIPVADSQGTLSSGVASGTFDLKAFFAQISGAGPSKTTTSGKDLINAWDFIPKGLVSTTSPQSGRTAIQKSLFEYGNEIGALVQGYDAAHRDQVQVMKDAATDRTNTAKEAAAEKIGQDLETVGQEIARINDTPSSATVQNNALSQSYTDSGKKLVAMTQALAGRDADLVSAIKTYDASVEAFTKNYVALASVFSSYGVTFGPSDSGSVFTFTPSAF